MNFRKVVVGPKVDLDTVGCAYFNGVTREIPVEVARSGQASFQDLFDPSVLCIEVGGAGGSSRGNFDHHEMGKTALSATMQAYEIVFEARYGTEQYLRTDALEVFYWKGPEGSDEWTDWQIASYIHKLDTEGPRALGRAPDKTEFPYLSDVFAGMLLSVRDPVEQFRLGVEMLESVFKRHLDAFGTIPGFNVYAKAKLENNRQIAEAVQSAEWSATRSGKKFAYLETDFFGAPGALYQQGAEIVVAFAPHFGNPPVPKFTVAGNGIKVDAALAGLNTLEVGWGGPPTGTIIGSPRAGSGLTLGQVVEVVIEAL